MKRNGLVWCPENHSVAVGHEKSGFNGKNAIIGLIVSAHQGSRISYVPTANQSVIRQYNMCKPFVNTVNVNEFKACDDANSKAS